MNLIVHFLLLPTGQYLSGYFSKTAEIRYQMDKLKARGLIEKRQRANYYRVTEKGYVWMNIAYSHNRYFLIPLLTTHHQSKIIRVILGPSTN